MGRSTKGGNLIAGGSLRRKEVWRKKEGGMETDLPNQSKTF